jgi:uncharacterized protein YdeI (YjbR/CyaY-like superfamily)
MRFRATVELGGKTATGIEVPEDVVAALGSGNRPRWIEEAKKPETRATRLAKTVESLHAGKRAR